MAAWLTIWFIGLLHPTWFIDGYSPSQIKSNCSPFEPTKTVIQGFDNHPIQMISLYTLPKAGRSLLYS